MPLELAIDRSKRWMTECASLVDGTSFDTSNRHRVAVSLMHLCVEHQQAIHTLVDHGLIGSAFALVRPQFEAYVRGAWFHRCATASQVDKFLGGGEQPKISPLLTSLKALPDYDGATLEATKKAIWDNLNDFTHGGAVQVKARNTLDEITLRYKHEHIAGLLASSATLSLLAGVGIAAIARNDTLGQNLYARYKSIYDEGA